MVLVNVYNNPYETKLENKKHNYSEKGKPHHPCVSPEDKENNAIGLSISFQSFV